MAAEPCSRALAALAPRRARSGVLQAAQPALTKSVVVAHVEPPAHRQSTGALLCRARAIREAPCEQRTITPRVRMLATSWISGHRRTVLVIGVALAIGTHLG
eukprot:2339209-Prymnesium_polylepis.2